MTKDPIPKWRTKRLKSLESGICTSCHKRKSTNGSELCDICRDWKRYYARLRRIKRTKAGLCKRCGTPTHGVTCQRCKERFKERYKKMKRNHLCHICGNPLGDYDIQRGVTRHTECRDSLERLRSKLLQIKGMCEHAISQELKEED